MHQICLNVLYIAPAPPPSKQQGQKQANGYQDYRIGVRVRIVTCSVKPFLELFGVFGGVGERSHAVVVQTPALKLHDVRLRTWILSHDYGRSMSLCRGFIVELGKTAQTLSIFTILNWYWVPFLVLLMLK